jgi:hypothetical protein
VWSAIDYFAAQGLRRLDLGSGAGTHNIGNDGLAQFKKGWPTGTETTISAVGSSTRQSTSAQAESNESRFRTMSSLFFGHETDFSAHAVEDATQEILRLQTAFSLTYGMDRKERRIHRAKVCSRVSWRLLDNARASVRRGNYVGAGRFVFHACRLYAPALFENRFTVPLPINVRR